MSGLTSCPLAPWGKPCGQPTAGLIRDREEKVQPACVFHLHAAEEFDLRVVPLSEVVRLSVDAHMEATLLAATMRREPDSTDGGLDSALSRILGRESGGES